MKLRILAISLSLLALAFTQNSMAAVQCFYQAGTYGNLTVTETGGGCGNFISYGGITGVWLGDGNIDENCQFDISPAVDGSTVEVRMTALDVGYPSYSEEVFFSLNGAFVAVTGGDIDNSYPPGGGPLSVSTGGAADPTVGGVTATGSGSGTVSFSAAPASVSSINVQHNHVVGAPNGTVYEICADDEGGVVEPDATARFTVTKDFTDDNPSPVEVHLTCNAGLPLEQSFIISDDDAAPPLSSSVTFVVTNFIDGQTDCWVTETAVDNYTPTYLASGDSQSEDSPEVSSCHFIDVSYADGNSCEITNTPEPGTYTVEMDWIVTDEDSADEPSDVEVTVNCQSDILTVNGSVVAPSTEYVGTLGDGDSVELGIDLINGASSCSTSQGTLPSGTEPQASADCTDGAVETGGGATCTFTNTLFFEGIPTLSQYGLVIMFLLMAGVGFVGLRRYT